MSKLINALRDADQSRNHCTTEGGSNSQQESMEPISQLNFLNNDKKDIPDRYRETAVERKEGHMKNQWLIWGLIILVIGIVFFAFNYQGNREDVPLSEIFPDQPGQEATEIEYVFMDAPTVPVQSEDPGQVPSQAVVSQDAPSADLTQPISRPVASSSRTASTPAKFTIQVASFKNEASAKKVVNELSASGHPAFVVDKDLGEKGIWYRIYVGRFQTKQEADRYISQLKDGYQNSFVLNL